MYIKLKRVDYSIERWWNISKNSAKNYWNLKVIKVIPVLEVSVDTSDGELKSGPCGARDSLGLSLAGILACFTSSHCNEIGIEKSEMEKGQIKMFEV